MTDGYELDDGHIGFLQWLRWYRSVYDMTPSDRPTDDLIENDEELDRWFAGFMNDNARKSGRRRGSPLLDPQANIPTFGGLS